MPRSAPGLPRKMLPPPTTTAISTPSSVFAAATSSAMRCTTAASMPEPEAASANTSPDSFSTTRSYLDASPNASPYAFFAILLVTTRRLLVADLDPHEAADGRILAELAQQLADRGLRLAEERLPDQDDTLVEGVDPAFDDLRDRLLRLPLVAGELLEHRPFPLDEHADVPPVALHVLVAVDDPVRALEARDAAQADVLADLGTELLDGLAHGPAVVRLVLEIGVALLGDELRERGDQAAEVGAFRHEVGLAGQLHHRAGAILDDHVDGAVLRRSPGAFRGAGETLGAQPVLGRLEITVGRLERTLAVEHAGAGLLAQRGDVLGRDLSHRRLGSRSWSPRPPAPRPARLRARSRTPRRRRCPEAAAASSSRRAVAPRVAPGPWRLRRGPAAACRPCGAPPPGRAGAPAPRAWRTPSRPSSRRGRGPPRRRRRRRGS